MEKWRKRVDWLLKDYITNKESIIALKDLVRFCNGDSSQEVMVHWCLQGPGAPCCSSDAESLAKCLSHLVPVLSKGYATPLLYRMKHYGQASSFVKFACNFFQILPRALQEMHNSTQADETSLLADAFLAETGILSAEAEFQQLLANSLEVDTNFALQNKVRREQVVAEMSKPSFAQGAIVTDALIQPVEHGINTLLKHTKLLHDMTIVGKGHPEWAELAKKAAQQFRHVTGGNLATDLIGMYLQFLQNGLRESLEVGFQPNQAMLDKIWQLVISCMTDISRRFSYNMSFPPLTLFSLLDMDKSEFVEQFGALQAKHQRCPRCLDADCSAKLMTGFANINLVSQQEQEETMVKVQQILTDLCQWCPLTSDVVELKHGQTQWSVSGRRGGQSAKNPKVAAQTTILQAAVKGHSWSKDTVSHLTLPSRSTSSSVLKMSGVRRQAGSSRQMTSRESQQERDQRIHKAQTRKIRRISGWNVFQRSKMEGSTVKKGEFKERLREIAKEWKQMNPEDRSAYEAEAAFQQDRIDSLAATPLPSKQEKDQSGGGIDKEEVWRNAKKKISCRRLAVNTQCFSDHSLWDLVTQFGDSPSFF